MKFLFDFLSVFIELGVGFGKLSVELFTLFFGAIFAVLTLLFGMFGVLGLLLLL